MDDVEKWLCELDLQQFASLFARFQIDIDSLRLLSDQDLQEMQIPLGPRKKISAAIKDLKEAADRPDQSQDSTERRQVTILFCDLVGSTEYAVRLDPEDYGKLTRRYLEQCASVVRRKNGMVITYIGDSLLALFGYPIAEEDDADRALEVALDILQMVPGIEVPNGPPVQVRIGVASGLSVIGNFLGAPDGVSTFAFGPITNLAQRLQALAEPQTILIDWDTYHATAGAFEYTDVGLHALKGFPETVRVWRVERPLVLESRFAKKTKLFELVGRSPQLSSIVKLWDNLVMNGHGRVVVLYGEPGIGKSRLAFEAHEKIPRCTHLALQCSAVYSNSALMPLLNLLKRYAGIRDEEPANETLYKLETILRTSEVPKSMSLPIFARLLSIDLGALPPSALSSLRQQGISRRVLVDWLHHVSQINPVLMTFEDVQWIDPSSRDVLDTLIKEVPFHPMLIIITSREGLEKPWSKAEHLLEIKLTRLSRHESETLVQNAAAGTSISDSLRAHILSKAEGVPLFIEELTRATIETGLPVEQREQEVRPLIADVPRSLQSSLVSRLDKLGPAKAIAQVAAVIGREFDFKLLAHVCGISSLLLESMMERLTDSGIVSPQLSVNRPRYAFSHALLQEAARSTLLRERCKELHKLVGYAIESLDPKTAAEHPELLAQHFAEAGMFDRAGDCWLAAGLSVAKTWAKVEAANMFSMGLACIEQLPPSMQRSQKALRLELERGDVLYATFGYITRDSSAAYRNAMRLSQELGDSEAPIRALDGLFGTAFNSARFVDAEWASDQLVEMGRKGENLKAYVLGLQFKGMSLFCIGNFRRARHYLESSLGYEARADLVGSDFPSMAFEYLSWTFHMLGYPRQAIELYSRAEVITRTQSAYRRTACLGNGCVLLALQKNSCKIREVIDELIPLAEENGFQLWLNMANFFLGWTMVNTNRDLNGLEKMQNICDDLGEQEIDKSCYLGLLADSYLHADELERADATIEQALEHIGSKDEQYFTAEIIRLRGDVQLRLKKDPQHAETLYREAMALARKQGARSWELSATRSLTFLLRAEGRLLEVENELSPVVAKFERRAKRSSTRRALLRP